MRSTTSPKSSADAEHRSPRGPAVLASGPFPRRASRCGRARSRASLSTCSCSYLVAGSTHRAEMRMLRSGITAAIFAGTTSRRSRRWPVSRADDAGLARSRKADDRNLVNQCPCDRDRDRVRVGRPTKVVDDFSMLLTTSDQREPVRIHPGHADRRTRSNGNHTDDPVLGSPYPLP